ncbi:transcriptional regulator, TetR family [Sphingomonas laterariae]|uniref:Transcriptional regulator, TetR family n=1 Tax=Edaphosphingomonas laterariae TaxID=861865 RepID=A0A239HG14_9SPHN|nr:TetR/AcrR family transcriptional regulator [Sphingomonas laterariae]SNS80232.1 transcriptional regulator, TetR family [Sphingomonas laterariae]
MSARQNKVAQIARTVRVPRTSRGEAARERIKEAARVVFNRVGYRKARVTDITDEAQVASGLFYRYFVDLRAIAAELSGEMIASFLDIEALLDPAAPDRLWEKLRVHHRIQTANYMRNPGLMRAWVPLSEDSPEFLAKSHSDYQRYLTFLVTDRWPEPNEPRTAERARRLMLGYAALGAGEMPLVAYVAWRTKSLKPLDLSEAALAEWMALLAYRMFTGRDPDPALLDHRDTIAALPFLEGLGGPAS